MSSLELAVSMIPIWSCWAMRDLAHRDVSGAWLDLLFVAVYLLILPLACIAEERRSQ